MELNEFTITFHDATQLLTRSRVCPGPKDTTVIHDTITRWHQHVHGANGVLDDILADDVVFYSPVVYTPQRGKAIAKEYLTAAVAAFVGPAPDIDDPNQTRATRFVYTK